MADDESRVGRLSGKAGAESRRGSHATPGSPGSEQESTSVAPKEVVLSRANVRAVLGDRFRPYVKQGTTMIAIVDRQVMIETIDGNVLPVAAANCIGLDDEGHPYPIARVIMEKSYRRVDPTG